MPRFLSRARVVLGPALSEQNEARFGCAARGREKSLADAEHIWLFYLIQNVACLGCSALVKGVGHSCRAKYGHLLTPIQLESVFRFLTHHLWVVCPTCGRSKRLWKIVVVDPPFGMTKTTSLDMLEDLAKG